MWLFFALLPLAQELCLFLISGVWVAGGMQFWGDGLPAKICNRGVWGMRGMLVLGKIPGTLNFQYMLVWYFLVGVVVLIKIPKYVRLGLFGEGGEEEGAI